ncbi:MAG: gliding motility-associated protein GldC [Bacteroidota bacterium]|jgi:gliding motility-associated protein GldC
MSQSAINIQIELDNNKVAEKILWEATDAGEQREAKAMILGFWDKQEKNTMRIDLWTKEMTVDEMKFFVHQTLLTLSDSFERSTGDTRMAATMKDFCEYYAEKMNLNPGV